MSHNSPNIKFTILSTQFHGFLVHSLSCTVFNVIQNIFIILSRTHQPSIPSPNITNLPPSGSPCYVIYKVSSFATYSPGKRRNPSYITWMPQLVSYQLAMALFTSLRLTSHSLMVSFISFLIFSLNEKPKLLYPNSLKCFL